MMKPFFPTRRRARAGFTLIEAAITTTIIGIGVVAMVELLTAGTIANGDSTELTTGVNLARNVREMSLGKTFDEVLDLDGTTWSPAVDSCNQAISQMSGWSQTISVQEINPDHFTATILDPDPDGVRITVSAVHNNKTVSTLSWLRFRPVP